MINVIVSGALGRMGSITVDKVKAAEDMHLAAAVDVFAKEGDVLSSLDQFEGQADLIIDFSHHTGTPALMQWAVDHNTAVIMCTTGHDEAE